jgi:uncharacterized protein
MKKLSGLILTMVLCNGLHAQELSKMQWFNEPAKWRIEDNKLKVDVTPKSDFWRATSYGFTVDDGTFYYTTRGGEFEVYVKISGDFKVRYDHLGLMLRIDEKHWIKTGMEFVDGKYNFSTVVTNEFSSWNVITLQNKPESLWIKAIRKKDAVEIYYSFDGKDYIMSNMAYFPEQKTAMVGMMAASPDGEGFNAVFENFRIVHQPDVRRLEWLEKNKE